MRTRLVLGGLAALLTLIQLIPVDRSNPPVEQEPAAPANVRAILERSCYDCHSNETRWPWYSYVAPASWLVAHDVREGREHLNFTTWNRYDEEEQREKIEEIWEEVEEGKMPLWYYRFVHRSSKPNDEDRAALEAWSTPGGTPE
jgi:hypothetical protein